MMMTRLALCLLFLGLSARDAMGAWGNDSVCDLTFYRKLKRSYENWQLTLEDEKGKRFVLDDLPPWALTRLVKLELYQEKKGKKVLKSISEDLKYGDDIVEAVSVLQKSKITFRVFEVSSMLACGRSTRVALLIPLSTSQYCVLLFQITDRQALLDPEDGFLCKLQDSFVVDIESNESSISFGVIPYRALNTATPISRIAKCFGDAFKIVNTDTSIEKFRKARKALVIPPPDKTDVKIDLEDEL